MIEFTNVNDLQINTRVQEEPLRVLIIEDKYNVADNAKDSFVEYFRNSQTDIACNSQEMSEKLRSNSYDVIYSDFLLQECERSQNIFPINRQRLEDDLGSQNRDSVVIYKKGLLGSMLQNPNDIKGLTCATPDINGDSDSHRFLNLFLQQKLSQLLFTKSHTEALSNPERKILNNYNLERVTDANFEQNHENLVNTTRRRLTRTRSRLSMFR